MGLPWKTRLAYPLFFLLTACMGSIPPQPWFEGETEWPSIHRFDVSNDEKPEPFELVTKIHYVDESSLWIYLYVNDFKRASMLIRYSAGEAYIEKEDGQRITPALYVTSPSAKNIPSSLPWGGKIPDIVVHEQTIDPNDSGGLHGGVSLRFDTAPPHASSRWVLHLGTVTIGDAEIEIPEKTIVVRARQWYTVPVQ